MNSNVVALIPKFPGADKLDNYRPIALANFKFKIICKVLADRLAAIAPKVVSGNQRGFIKGRHIQDCVCITSEIINLLEKRSFGGNIALKIDMKKAFNTLDWNFLIHVLQAFGFNATFCKWMRVILHSAKLSFSVNGHAVGHFPCKRGVRQGDLLSPLLFCLAEDMLSRGISKLVCNYQLFPMSGPRGWQIPSHAFYADDIMIFCRASKQNLLHLMALFKAYGEASSQIISPAKCKFYPSGITPRRLGILANILGFSVGQHPFSYLGVPIFKCRPKKQHLQPIADIIKTKLASWKGSMLSIMGRVQLIKSVIQGMLLYSFHVYAWPDLLIKSVDSWIRNFIWFGDTSTKKIVTVAWSKVCTPYAAGGLGIRPLRGINDVALLKLCWQMFTSKYQWASFCRPDSSVVELLFPIMLAPPSGLVSIGSFILFRKILLGNLEMVIQLISGLINSCPNRLWIFFLSQIICIPSSLQR